jgi:soluble lytic murein transglycosylase-like protein
LRRRLLALLVVTTTVATIAATSAKIGERPARAAALSTAPKRLSSNPCPLPPALGPAFRAAARETGLPVSLLVAVGRIESNLRQNVSSNAGARGLLQVMPETASELRLDPDRPSTNVLAGARYLRRLLDRFGSLDLALAAYNAGPTAVTRAGGAPHGAVLTYVANVQEHQRALAGCT